ncbi:hypothetical protein IAQ61_011164 [Plenodomus lingam]|uniref:uncharacterized protein n=1 Tax=Leptosphaeria maculans TaxID=5022 RepID=UPI00331CCD70|nr:hypothetical protein IAQ61_011164 [Plenodomus lingam]
MGNQEGVKGVAIDVTKHQAAKRTIKRTINSLLKVHIPFSVEFSNGPVAESEQGQSGKCDQFNQKQYDYSKCTSSTSLYLPYLAL